MELLCSLFFYIIKYMTVNLGRHIHPDMCVLLNKKGGGKNKKKTKAKKKVGTL